MPEDTLDIIAATAFGLEAVVVRELDWLGYEAKSLSTGRVHFRGDAMAVARANLWLRAADRVLIRVGHFQARDFEALYETVKALPWEEWIAADAAFPVNGRSVKSQLSSVPACQRCVKKAIVERLRSAYHTQLLPETGGRVVIEISLLNDMATLTIDTTGDGLHKRGYRQVGSEAALKETLAAGLVLLSAWRPDRPLVDPFCGTGTIAIEAAMIGKNIAPGHLRSFDAETWNAIPAAIWKEARDEARAKATGELGFAIHASDIDERALTLGRHCAKWAGVDRFVHFHQRSFEQLSSKAEYGCIITNPPYGVRMGDTEEIEHLYRSMPLVLRGLPTWSFHVLTARQDLEYLVGQEASRRRKLFNSQIECTYFMFWGPKPPSMRRGEAATVATGAVETPGELRNEEDADVAAVVGEFQHTLPDIPVAPETELIDVVDEVGTSLRGRELPRAAAARIKIAINGAAVPDRTEVAQSSDLGGAVNMPAFGGLRERDQRELHDFASCLAKNVRHLRKYPSRGITCYRIYDRDQVDVPLIIDIYEGRIHIVEYEREHSRTFAQQADWYDAVRAIVAEATEIALDRIYIKEKHRQRGLSQHEKISELRDAHIVHEGGLSFEVNLSDYIDTGLFLDHRQTRAMIREQAAGKRFLNLFCYTGSFTVYAAAGGSTSTTSVDLSNTYLEWAQRNLSINRLVARSNMFVRDDVLDFLRNHSPGPHYDLAVVDPPTFSNSKSTEEDWEVAVGHTELFRRLIPLMSKGGVIYFSTNYRRFKLDEQLLADLGVSYYEVSGKTVPPDFRNKRIHRCWRMVVGDGALHG